LTLNSRHRRPLVILLALLGWVSCTCAAALAGPSDGSIIGATKFIDHGPDAERLNLVIIAEGFTLAEQDAFNNYAQQLVNSLFAFAPFDSFNAAMNVWRLNVASNQAGADENPPCDPEGVGVFVDTYFDASFCNSGIERLLLVNQGLTIITLNNHVPSWDYALVIVNSPIYGGAGGQVATTSLAGSWEQIVIHELGHTAFGLADEYEYWAGCGVDSDRDNHPAAEPSEPNVTTKTVLADIKWKDLILPATPLPTTNNANCDFCDPQPNPFGPQKVGLYEGAHYYHCDAYRPQYNCMMRQLGQVYCTVCKRVARNTLVAYMPVVCECPWQGDYDADGFLTAVDLARLINIVYFGSIGTQDPDCPVRRGDLDFNGFTDTVDLALMIDHVFFGGPGPADPCE